MPFRNMASGSTRTRRRERADPMLQLQDITFGYDRKHPLYRGIDLAFASDERVALSAPSGFGKTTLCRIMAGYLQPWSGRVLADGEPLPSSGRSPVQLIIQHPEQAVDPRQRMESVLAEAGVPEPALLERFGIRDAWMRRFPHELSGGELQRFCVVRALMAEPRYLIADEISTMLDASTQAQIWRALMQEAEQQSMGIVLVTHSASLADHIATRTVRLG